MARGLTNVTLVHGDAMSDDVNEALRGAAPFDVITCSSALIYMPSVPAALRRFASWLAPGGRLAVNTPMVRLNARPNRMRPRSLCTLTSARRPMPRACAKHAHTTPHADAVDFVAEHARSDGLAP